MPAILRTAATLFALAMLLPASAQPVARGGVPPDVLGSTLEGEDVHLTDFAGKVVVVTFWASWCAPCRKELPMLEGIQRVAGKDRVRVVAVNIEDRDRFRQVAKALAKLSVTFTHDDRKRASDAYGVHGIPHLVLIGRDGRVLQVHRGYSEEGIDAIIDEVNAALAVPAPAAS